MIFFKTITLIVYKVKWLIIIFLRKWIWIFLNFHSILVIIIILYFVPHFEVKVANLHRRSPWRLLKKKIRKVKDDSTNINLNNCKGILAKMQYFIRLTLQISTFGN